MSQRGKLPSKLLSSMNSGSSLRDETDPGQAAMNLIKRSQELLFQRSMSRAALQSALQNDAL